MDPCGPAEPKKASVQLCCTCLALAFFGEAGIGSWGWAAAATGRQVPLGTHCRRQQAKAQPAAKVPVCTFAAGARRHYRLVPDVKGHERSVPLNRAHAGLGVVPLVGARPTRCECSSVGTAFPYLDTMATLD